MMDASTVSLIISAANVALSFVIWRAALSSKQKKEVADELEKFRDEEDKLAGSYLELMNSVGELRSKVLVLEERVDNTKNLARRIDEKLDKILEQL